MQSATVVVLYLQKTHVTCSYLCCQVLCFSVRPNSWIKYVFHQTWNFFIALIRAKKTLCPSSHSLNQFVATVANHTCLHNMHLPARMSPLSTYSTLVVKRGSMCLIYLFMQNRAHPLSSSLLLSSLSHLISKSYLGNREHGYPEVKQVIQQSLYSSPIKRFEIYIEYWFSSITDNHPQNEPSSSVK